ncbi:MAG TPA: zf-HC2 domain-containing protein [Bacteroidia bacterium]|nr:zf-HC2 domain-containing protein [Bacteroidia bacterium]
MADEIKYIKLTGHECLNREKMFAYIDGQLSPADMHEVEAHLLDCPFCSDALEGLEKVKDRHRVPAAVPPLAENAPVKKRGRILPLFPFANVVYGAVAGVLLVVGIITLVPLLFQNGDNASKKLAQNTSEKKNEDSSVVMAREDRALDSVAAANIPAMDADRAAAQSRYESSGGDGPADVSDSGRNMFADVSADKNRESSAEEKWPAHAGLPKSSGNTGNDVTNDLAQSKAVQEDDDQAQKTAANDYVAQDESKNKDLDKPDNFSNAGGSKKENHARSNAASAAAPPAQANVNISPAYNSASGASDVVQDSVSSGTATLLSDADIELYYRNGVSMYDSGQLNASIAFFDKVLQYPQNKNYEDAQWMKAQALARTGKTDDAKALLNEIIEAKGKHKKDAEKLLKTL